MKKLALLALAMLSANAMAANVLFSGNQTEACSLVVTQGGALNFDTATSFSTVDSYKGKVQVTNNDAGAFVLTQTTPTDFSYKPTGYTGTTTFSSSFDMSGVNSATDTLSATLTNSGVDVVEMQLNGSSDVDYVAGTYQSFVVISCDAI